MTVYQGDVVSLPAYEGLRPPGSAVSPARPARPLGAAVRGLGAAPQTPRVAPLRPAGPTASGTDTPSGTEMPRPVTLRLTGAERGCAQARDVVRRTLDDWGLAHRTVDALTVVTELLANAVLHAGGDGDIWLRLSLRRPGHLVCAVIDPSDSPPVYPHTSDPFDEHGRGLRIIEALSEHWGWTRRPPAGKTVWAMLRADEPDVP